MVTKKWEQDITHEDKLSYILEKKRLLETMRKQGFSTPKKFAWMLKLLNSIERDITTCNIIEEIEDAPR